MHAVMISGFFLQEQTFLELKAKASPKPVEGTGLHIQTEGICKEEVGSCIKIEGPVPIMVVIPHIYNDTDSVAGIQINYLRWELDVIGYVSSGEQSCK